MNNNMAGLRKLVTLRSAFSYSSLLPPALLISHRSLTTKLFVGGLSYYATEDGLSEAFSQYGQVLEAKIVMDRTTQKSKGFGFVTFASDDDGHRALEEMNGKTLNGRVIFVDYAKPETNTRSQVPIARGPPKPVEPQEE